MARVYGTYERSLDAKGRVMVPPKLRSEFGENAFLAWDEDGCLALHDLAAWDSKERDMEERAKQSEEGRKAARFWASTGGDVTFDAQGRIPIPSRLRELAGLGDEVLVVGNIHQVEIWSPARYNEIYPNATV